MSKWICYWDSREWIDGYNFVDVEQEPFIIKADSYEEAEQKAYKHCDRYSDDFGYEVCEYEEEEEDEEYEEEEEDEYE